MKNLDANLIIKHDLEGTSKADKEKKLLAYKEKQRLELLAYEQSLIEDNATVENTTPASVTSENLQSAEEHLEYVVIKNTLEATSEKEDSALNYLQVADPSKLYDDLPDLDHIPASEILDSLLKGSKDTLLELETYIRNNHSQVITDDKNVVSKKNFYRLDDKIYFFNKDQWIKITQILSQCKNLDCLERTLKKSSVIKNMKEQVLACIMNINKEEENTIYKRIIQGLDLDLVVQAVLKTLNYQIIQHYTEKKNKLSLPSLDNKAQKVKPYTGMEKTKALTFNFTYIIQHLGNLLGGMYLEKYFYEIDEYTKEEDVKGKPLYVHKQVDENTVKDFVMKINDETIAAEDYGLQVTNKINEKTYSKFITLIEDKKVFDYLNATIYINEIESIENPELDVEALTIIKDRFDLNLGIVLVNEMLKEKLLTKELVSKEDNKKEWYLILGETLESQINASAVFYKPRLVDFEIDTSYQHILDKLELKVSLKNQQVKQSADVELTLKEPGKKVLDIQSPMMIARDQYINFIEYTRYILDKAFNTEDEEILTYLQIIYNIDFRIIKENTQHNALLEIVMKYGLDLDSNYTRSLGEECLTSKSILAVYNKICSYKYHLKCMLNDCNLFRNFNYFYLDRFATSTLRQFTRIYSLNLQGAKIVRSFVICAKLSHNKVTKEKFSTFINIVKEQISTEKAIKYLDKLKYTHYMSLKANTYEGYCKHFIKAEYNYKEFPIKSSYLGQVTWLSTRIKKPRDILLAQLVLSSRNKQDQLLIEEDATSSGVQLTTILLRKEEVAVLSNILGQKYTDLYSMHYKEYHEDIILAKEFTTKVLTHLGLPSIASILEMDKLGSLDEVKGLGQLLEYVIYGKEEDMYEVIQRLLSTLTSIMQNGTLKAIQVVYPKDANWLPNSALVNIMMTNLPVKGDSVTYLIRCLLNVRQAYKYELCLRKNPWIELTKALEARQLSKLPIMAYAYGLGAKGRKEDFLEYMEQTALDNGFDNIDYSALEELSSTIERYFLKFEFKYIKELRVYVEIVSNYVENCAEKRKAMYFDNKYCLWEYEPHKNIISSRPRVSSEHNGKVKRLSLYTRSATIAYDSAESTLCSIFVHSADAWIVYRFYEKLNAMNDRLYEENLPMISSFTNQDNFATTLVLAMFLKLLVADCYNEFSDINYIQQLYSPASKNIYDEVYSRELIKVLNSHFIRH